MFIDSLPGRELLPLCAVGVASSETFFQHQIFGVDFGLQDPIEGYYHSVPEIIAWFGSQLYDSGQGAKAM